MSRSLADRSPNNNGNGRSNGSGGCHCPPDQELVVLIKSATDGTEIEQVVALIYEESSTTVALFVRRVLSTVPDEIIEDTIVAVWDDFITKLNREGFELTTTFQELLLGIARQKIGILIFEENVSFVESFVKSRLSSASVEVIANVVSDVWQGFFEKMNGSNFKIESSFQSYLKGIASYKIKDYFRNKGKGIAPGTTVSIIADLSGDELLFRDEDSNSMTTWEITSTDQDQFQDPDTIIPIIDTYNQALCWLEEKHHRYYQVLRLVIEEDLTDQQIADRLNLTPVNVRARKMRAREKLREFLSDG